MIELSEDNVYRVKNFAKHQNIKVKEKIKSKDEEKDVKNEEVKGKENLNDKIYGGEMHGNKDKELENKIDKSEVESIRNDCTNNLESIHEDIERVDNNRSDEKINSNSQNSIPILLETQKSKKAVKKKKKDSPIEVIDEESEDDKIVCFYDGDEGRTLGEGESVISEWAF